MVATGFDRRVVRCVIMGEEPDVVGYGDCVVFIDSGCRIGYGTDPECGCLGESGADFHREFGRFIVIQYHQSDGRSQTFVDARIRSNGIDLYVGTATICATDHSRRFQRGYVEL